MKPFTDAEKEAFHSGRQKYLRLVFSDETIVDNVDIASESMNFSQTICDDSQLTLGSCSSACFRIQLLGVAQRYAGLTVTVTISAIDLEGVTHTRQIGVFKVVSDKATSNKLGRDLECYDKLYDILPADYSTWYNSLQFPMTLKAYRDAFFQHVGIVQETAVLVNDDMTVTKNFVAENYSGKDVLQDICEINGVFGILNSDNKFQYIKVKEPGKALFPRNDLYPSDELYPIDASGYLEQILTKNDYYAGSLNYEEYTVQQITQLQIRMSENDIGAIVGTPGNTYIIQDNPLVYGKTTQELTVIGDNVLHNIDKVTYVPISIQIPANLWFELGDSIRIHTDNDIIPTVLLTVNLTGITALKQRWESSGQEYYTEKANSVERSIMVVKQKTNELERNVEETKFTITEVQEDLEENVETLQSQITQNATSITAEVTRASTAEGNLSTRITQTSDAITSEVTRATNAESNLSTRITQTDSAITSEVTRATNAEGTLASRVSQTESDITLKVSKGDVSSQLSVESGQVTLSSNRLVINSTNFTLDANGNITANNASITGATITGGSLTVTEANTNKYAEVSGGYVTVGRGSTEYGGISASSGNGIAIDVGGVVLPQGLTPSLQLTTGDDIYMFAGDDIYIQSINDILIETDSSSALEINVGRIVIDSGGSYYRGYTGTKNNCTFVNGICVG